MSGWNEPDSKSAIGGPCSWGTNVEAEQERSVGIRLRRGRGVLSGGPRLHKAQGAADLIRVSRATREVNICKHCPESQSRNPPKYCCSLHSCRIPVFPFLSGHTHFIEIPSQRTQDFLNTVFHVNIPICCPPASPPFLAGLTVPSACSTPQACLGERELFICRKPLSKGVHAQTALRRGKQRVRELRKCPPSLGVTVMLSRSWDCAVTPPAA